MKHAGLFFALVLLLFFVVACGLLRPTAIPTPQSAMLPTVPPPTQTATPKPTATWVPALTSEPIVLPTQLPDELQSRMDAIQVEVSLLRGLEAVSPITRRVTTREDMAALFETRFAEEYSPEKVKADTRVLAAFDFVPADFDLRGLLLELYSDQVVGLYDDVQQVLYIVSDSSGAELDLLDQMTFAHEYTHGLQDEHYDLGAFADDMLNDDEILARMSLVEGDASLVMTQFLMAHLFEYSANDLAELETEGVLGGNTVLETAPAIIRETSMFPYLQGMEFVAALQKQGWEAIDLAYADPPQSTEQILHPAKYLVRDEPQLVSLPSLTDTLGVGWWLVEAQTLGEFQTRLFLAQLVGPDAAERASKGWDGDRYALYARDDADVLVWATAWDGPMDREEFVAAYTRYAEVKYGQPPEREEERVTVWETADQVAIVSWEQSAALVVLGPDRATVDAVIAATR